MFFICFVNFSINSTRKLHCLMKCRPEARLFRYEEHSVTNVAHQHHRAVCHRRLLFMMQIPSASFSPLLSCLSIPFLFALLIALIYCSFLFYSVAVLFSFFTVLLHYACVFINVFICFITFDPLFDNIYVNFCSVSGFLIVIHYLQLLRFRFQSFIQKFLYFMLSLLCFYFSPSFSYPLKLT